MRLFIAIDTPSEVRPQILELQRQLRSFEGEVRWEPPEKLHATLKFLGESDEGRLDAIVAAIEQIAHTSVPMTFVYRTVGCFPNAREPRVIWIGIEEASGVLESLQVQIEDAMAGFGYEKEKRKFHPHLTLGRVKGQRHIHGLIERLKTVTFESQPVVIREMIIVKSDLKPSGSVYTTLKTVQLGV